MEFPLDLMQDYRTVLVALATKKEVHFLATVIALLLMLPSFLPGRTSERHCFKYRSLLSNLYTDLW